MFLGKVMKLFLIIFLGFSMGCGDDTPSNTNNKNNKNNTQQSTGKTTAQGTTRTPTHGNTNQTTQTTNNGTTNNGTTGRTTSQGREPKNHRSVAVMCDNVRPDGNAKAIKCSTDEDCRGRKCKDGECKAGQCSTDKDCTDGANGRCNFSRAGATCSYDACFQDNDCDGVCECESPKDSTIGNQCLPGNCKVDSDCQDTGFCSPTLGTCGNYSGTEAYYCHTPEDECLDDSDCKDFSSGGAGRDPYCTFSSEVSHWVCADAHCVG